MSQPLPLPDVIVTFSPDVSYFEYVNQTLGYALQVLYSLWAALNVVLAILFLIGKGQHLHVPWLAVIALTLEAFCNLWRFSFLVVDPWLSNSVYPFQYFAVIGGFLYSISCSATWVIAFFWFRFTVLARKDRWSPQSVIAILIGVLLLLASEFVPRALTISSISFFDLIKVFFVLQCIFHGLLAVFFVSTGAAVLRIAYKGHKLQPDTTRFSQVHIARFLIIDAVLLVTVAGVSGLLLSDRVFSDDFWFAQNFALDGLYLAISTTQIAVFRERIRCGLRRLERTRSLASGDQIIRLRLPCCGTGETEGMDATDAIENGAKDLASTSSTIELGPALSSIAEDFSRSEIQLSEVPKNTNNYSAQK